MYFKKKKINFSASVHSSIICGSQNMETAQMSINLWTDEQIVV